MSEHPLNLVQIEMFPPIGILKTNFRFFDELGMFTKFVQNFSGYETLYEHAVTGLQSIPVHSRNASALKTDVRKFSRKMSELRDGIRPVIVAHLEATTTCSKPLAIELPDRSFRMAEVTDHDDLLAKVHEARGFWIFLFHPCELLTIDGLKSIGKMM